MAEPKLLIYNSRRLDGRYVLNTGDQIGDGMNYSEFESDGTLVMAGTATVFDDIYVPISITKLGVTAPSWDPFHGNLEQFTFAINDYVQGSFEVKHDYKEGTDLDIHVHVVTNGAEASKEVRYSFEYWVADMDDASTTTSTLTCDDYALTNADGHHEYIDIGDISGTGLSIGAVVCFLFKRVALSDGDNPSEDPFVVSLGVHYEIDTLGSRQETTK